MCVWAHICVGSDPLFPWKMKGQSFFFFYNPRILFGVRPGHNIFISFYLIISPFQDGGLCPQRWCGQSLLKVMFYQRKKYCAQCLQRKEPTDGFAASNINPLQLQLSASSGNTPETMFCVLTLSSSTEVICNVWHCSRALIYWHQLIQVMVWCVVDVLWYGMLSDLFLMNGLNTTHSLMVPFPLL